MRLGLGFAGKGKASDFIPWDVEGSWRFRRAGDHAGDPVGRLRGAPGSWRGAAGPEHGAEECWHRGVLRGTSSPGQKTRQSKVLNFSCPDLRPCACCSTRGHSSKVVWRKRRNAVYYA